MPHGPSYFRRAASFGASRRRLARMLAHAIFAATMISDDFRQCCHLHAVAKIAITRCAMFARGDFARCRRQDDYFAFSLLPAALLAAQCSFCAIEVDTLHIYIYMRAPSDEGARSRGARPRQYFHHATGGFRRCRQAAFSHFTPYHASIAYHTAALFTSPNAISAAHDMPPVIVCRRRRPFLAERRYSIFCRPRHASRLMR